jgi:DNA repair exonuclease SbcCD nuclease subunit
MTSRQLVSASLLLLGLITSIAAQDDRRSRPQRGRKPAQNSTCNNVPEHPFDLVLGRPEQDSVTMSVLVYRDVEGFVAYGTELGKYAKQTPAMEFKKGDPVEVVVGSLKPDTQYFYQFRAGELVSPQNTFHTQRPPGSEFTFTITADSHLDDRVSAELYQRTLANALADRPDFNIDLGDTFMSEKHDNRANALRQYLAQRYYFGQLCRSAPLFLVLGNHDGESRRGRGDESDSLAVWSNRTRKHYFANPVPDNFYTGNSKIHPEAGLLQDYYAWTWGDALFIVLDPFWYTRNERGRQNNWKRSLGEDQYQWLRHTLEASNAKMKFVFIHHLVGGATPEGRGGAEAVPYYEWGGHNSDGSDGFKENRPGWPTPIHDLLVKNRVTAVFHGHDHLYVKQERDGIVYQEVPQPGDPRGNTRTAKEYGYTSGVLLGSSGHLRVRVSAVGAHVDYVRACLPDDNRSVHRNAEVAHSYEIAVQKAGSN